MGQLTIVLVIALQESTALFVNRSRGLVRQDASQDDLGRFHIRSVGRLLQLYIEVVNHETRASGNGWQGPFL